jgi:hypothetical protein
MRGACSTHEGGEINTKCYSENLTVRDRLGDSRIVDDNIKMSPNETGCEDVTCIQVTQDSIQWRIL